MKRIALIIFLVGYHGLIAQSDSTKTQGEIVSGEVLIEKDNEIILPQADKIFIRSTPRSFGSQSIEIDFLDNEPTFEWPNYKSRVPFQLINEEYPKEDYQNYVLAGFGNYSSPLLEAGLYRTFAGIDAQAKIFYESFQSGPVNGDNSGNAQGGINLSGTYKTEKIALTPSITFKNSQYSFYGNADRINNGFDSSNPEDISLNEFGFDLSFKGSSEDINYSIAPLVGITTQKLEANALNKESVFGVNGSLDYKIDDAFVTGFELDAKTASYDGGLQVNRSLVNIKPWVNYKKDQLSILAGFMVSSGTVDDASKTGFYPHARAAYSLTDKWSLYGFVSGGQTWNGLNDLINENQFLDDSLLIVNSENTLQFGGGLKGSPIKHLLLDASLSYRSIKLMPFYVPSGSDSSRYSITYDLGSVGVVTLKSSLAYMPSTSSTYGVSLEINGYSMESLDRPWHKPAYILKAYTSHNIQEKLIVSAFLTSMGGIRGPANVNFGYVNLSAFTDLGLGAKYLVSQRASAFIQVNNLLNSEYERYLGYPTRGITFKLGGQYRF